MQQEILSKPAQRQRTLAKLLEVARYEFATNGYDGTATNRIVEQAQLTRGALYYHFKDKKDLFRRVVEQIAQEVLDLILQEALAQDSTWECLIAGCNAFIDACATPKTRQIFLIDAPAVLGWEEWREIDARYAMGSLEEGLKVCMDAGDIAPTSLPVLTHLISGALNEAALVIAESDDPDSMRGIVKTEVEALLAGIRVQRAA